ncbi:hypothetical protein RS130_19765 [Paraglaciecola aquimarina]|uniref:Porin domain-containing protein n=1 Tax=Paraglaciecola aquimarina TaxID=1235557 RepID=A0ABU3T0S1_9ALTE|nr:hypothetical protein [Paraglaciecola aquimarina]MDU0355823.1 hypothetical protein [Paraglaciecola aquimarina]
MGSFKISTSILLAGIAFNGLAVETTGVVQVNYVLADGQQSWIDSGTGILAYSKNGPTVQQALVKLSDTLSDGFSYSLVANYYQLGEQHLGISQGQLAYKPLSNSTVRWRARAGFFYPKMSLENVDTGWLSPFTYTQSAINSWIGEELRTAGLELTVFSPGRVRRSAWSWEVHGAVFKANDPLGTVISWRGFALHDRQSLNNDKVQFAPYPSVVEEDQVFHPSYVEPFHELDGHMGFYLGAHLDYYKQTNLRYYYYDNQADPLAVSNERLYGWRTKFHSLAVQHKFNSSTRLIGQWLTGSSAMGPRVTYVNFDAAYLMLSHKIKKHRLSVRYDHFKVRENDAMPADKNNSDGKAITMAWRYTLDQNWQLGVEHHFNQNRAENRFSLGEDVAVNQQQSMAVIQFRW